MFRQILVEMTDSARPRVAFTRGVRSTDICRVIADKLPRSASVPIAVDQESSLSPFDDYEHERRFRAAWESVRIARNVPYGLFTFGESELPYYLVLEPKEPGGRVSLREGMIKITRPLIITPDNLEPEFEDFFASDDEPSEAGYARYMLARTASFSHLRLKNRAMSDQLMTDSVEETVERLNRKLDQEDEDRQAILTAPLRLAGLAVMRYATERVMHSAADNITELREHGFLP
jgi:hypothetical protein